MAHGAIGSVSYDHGVELWLIRHALPLRIDGGDGPADPALAPDGLEQAKRLAAWWAPLGADAVYTSPMRRARETAEPLARALGLEPTVVDDLREYDAHESTYVPLEDLRADPDLWAATVEAWLSPEAEARRQEFREEVVRAVDGVVSGAHQRAVVVCHGGVINAYLSRVLSLPGTMFFEPAYTGVSRVLAGPSHRQLVSLNEAPHIEGLFVPVTAG